MKFYNVAELCADKIAEIKEFFPSVVKNHFSIAALYRTFIPELLPKNLETAIYLDSDIVVNLNIAELWRMELGDKVLGVVPEIFNKVNTPAEFPLVADGLVKAEDYFNSGVLLMNLMALRGETETIKAGMKFIAEHPKYSAYSDQEVLNYCFSTQTLKLPAKFNYSVREARYHGEMKVDKKIYHYLGRSTGLDVNDDYNFLWLSSFIKTPFFDEYAMSRLYEKFQQKDSETKNLLIKLTSAMNDRRRAFVTFADYIENIKRVFAATDDELLVIENFRDTAHLINTLKKLREQKVFISLLENYPLLREWLTAEGFIENRDFFDGTKFLATSHGWQISSYDFIATL